MDIFGAFFRTERSALDQRFQAGANPMKTSGNTILVTGGGSGIGEALAHRLHDAGNTVIVAGRRREALEQAIVGRANMHALELDVESSEGVVDFAGRSDDHHQPARPDPADQCANRSSRAAA
jgi:NAD(P)-dependent dehydrogenase (short-subunit alcohol dehydrogenase family)